MHRKRLRRRWEDVLPGIIRGGRFLFAWRGGRGITAGFFGRLVFRRLGFFLRTPAAEQAPAALLFGHGLDLAQIGQLDFAPVDASRFKSSPASTESCTASATSPDVPPPVSPAPAVTAVMSPPLPPEKRGEAGDGRPPARAGGLDRCAAGRTRTCPPVRVSGATRPSSRWRTSLSRARAISHACS